MASNSGKAWGGGIGSWALEAEEAEKESAEQSQSFPSLKEAAAAVGKSKKKKGTKLTLSEFTTGTHVGPGGGSRGHKDSVFEPKGLTTDEILTLPTGPRERSAEEIEQGRFGGGFRNYGSYGGGGGGGGFRREEGEREGRRGYGSGFSEEGRRGAGPRGEGFDQMPSRADEVDNWGAGKKISGFGGESRTEIGGMGRRDRYENLGSGGGGTLRADVDDWSMGKKQVFPSRSSGGGFGFRDSSSGSADSDRWVKGVGFGGASGTNGEQERPRLVLNPPKKDAGMMGDSEPAKTRPSPFGAARPREEILAEKGVDWRKVDSEIDTKRTSRPTSSHSSRPLSGHSSRGSSPAPPQNVMPEVKPRPKINPFGDAKPREVLLEEKGKDWRKIDMELEHRSIDRPETEQEILLKEEIGNLKMIFSEATDGQLTDHSPEKLSEIHDTIITREKELEKLVHELDDKVKFGQKAIGEIRPGSAGTGRAFSFSERPPSRSSIPDESRNLDFVERPGSRGSAAEVWSRPDDRRGSRMSKEGGFFSGRETDRARSRERW